ncbi:hypothetical protein Efla_000516 [Eimeria flavescens]
MLRKTSGARRLWCDSREINKVFLIPQQPLPQADGILSSFKGKRCFSVLDMGSGFYHIEIAVRHGPKTSSGTPACQRQWRRLAFGFASSPAIAERMVDMLLGEPISTPFHWSLRESAFGAEGRMACAPESMSGHEGRNKDQD